MKKDDKKIEEFIDRLMSTDTLEKPSLDFTDKVMAKVEAISKAQTIVYKPLIPKSAWILIALSVAALVGYIIFYEPNNSVNWLDKINLSQVSINPFENVNFSRIMVYAIVLLAVMVGIQVPLLKHYFNKRIAY